MGKAGVLQGLEIAGAVPAKPEVIADYQVGHAETPMQQALDERIRGHVRQRRIEAQAHEPIDATVSQRFELLTKAGQSCRRPLGGEVLLGRGLEGHHGRRQLHRPGPLLQLPQHMLMPEMNAIVVADRSDTSAVPGTQIVKAANQLHPVSPPVSCRCHGPPA